MTLRKWLVRGLVLVIVSGLAAGAFVYLRWTDPAAVRQQVVAQLGGHLPGAFVTLDAARLRLLGGIAISELRVVRRDDPDRTDLLYVPGGVIYHDKEQLAQGRLAVRKFVMDRPRFRIIRGPDGRWNTREIIGPVDLTKSIPTIVIQNGTIFVEDRSCPALPVVEIKDVNLTLINDPLPTLTFHGSGRSDVAGVVHLRGSWQRATEELETAFDVPAFAVGPTLVQRLAAYSRPLADHARHLQGTGNLNARFHFRPESQQWDHDLRLGLKQGRLEHAYLPLPLEELQAAARLVNGRVTLDSLTARAGAARVRAAGERESLREDAELRGELTVENLELTPDLFKRLPNQLDALQKVQADFAPAGPIDLAWKIQLKDKELVQEGTVTLRGLSLCCAEFRYPVTAVTGTLEVQVAPEKHLAMCRIDLAGQAAGQPLRITGTVAGPKPAAVDVKITAQSVPLDETLLAALRPPFQEQARSFHARGTADVEAFIRREQDAEGFHNRYLVHFHDLALRYDVFPYPLERVSATLDILPDHWRVTDLAGRHKGAEVHGHGRSHPAAGGGQRIEFELRGKDLLLDAELKKALEESAAAAVKPVWETFQPSGRADFRVLLDIPAGQTEPLVDATLVARNCTVTPAFFPWALAELNGTIHYTPGKVELRNLSARHGDSVVQLRQGDVYLKPEGGYFVSLPELRADPLLPDADFVRALPAPLQTGVAALQLRDRIGLAIQVIVDVPPDGAAPLVYWDGGVVLQNTAVRLGVPFEQVSGRVACRGRHNGRQLEGLRGHVQLEQAVLFDQPLRNVHAGLEVWKDSPDVLRVPELTAGFFGGSVGGEARVEFGPTFRYELDLTALQVRLDQLGRHNLRDKADWSGEAVARLYLRGEGAELTGLEGGGSIDVPNGKLYNLPLLLDLLKFLSVRWPDRTAFEEAHFRFSIHGPRVQINRLELLGSALSFGGTGQMNLDGSDMDLDLYTVWGRIMQMLPAAVKDVPPWFSKQFLKIKARGRVGNPQFDREAMPALVGPVKELWQKMAGER